MVLRTDAVRRSGSKDSSHKSKGQSIWKEILQEATKTADFQDSHLLVLGRKDVGKSSIIRSLQYVGAPNNALDQMEEYGNVDAVSALDFAFLNVRNVEDEDPSQALAKCNLWIIQHTHHKPLLMDKLKPEFLARFGVLIFLDMSQPWAIREDLLYWLDFAKDVICNLLKELPVEEGDMALKKLEHYTSHYKQKTLHEKAEDFIKRHMDDGGANEGDVEDTLMMNMGVPIVVCCAKSDTYKLLDTRTTQGHIDVIGAHLRNLCIPYGAALIYANAKEAKNTTNIELLYRYLMHRIYDFEFREVADLESGDGLFLPSGWDTVKEIEAFAATTTAEGLTKPFESIIVRPVPENVFSDAASRRTEAMNTFLGHALAANPACAAVSRSERRPGDDREKEKDRDRDRERDREKDKERERSGKGDRDKDRERLDRKESHPRDKERDKDRDRDREDRHRSSKSRDKDRDRDREREHGGSSSRGQEAKPLKNYFQNLLVKHQANPGGESSRERREGEKSHRDRDKDRDTHRERDRDKDRERERDRDKDRDKEKERDKDKEKEEKKEKKEDDETEAKA